MTLRASRLFNRRPGHSAGTIAAIALTILCGAAYASGDYGPPPSRFVAANGADVDSARLESGHVGVIQTGWPRLRLYAAWRAMALDAKGLLGPALPAGTLDRLTDPKPDATEDCSGPACVLAWRQAAQAVLVDPQRDNVSGTRLSPDYADYTECAPDAFATASRTLASLRARPDATSERLRAWVDAQDAVFSNCDLPTPIPENWRDDSYRKDLIDRKPTPRIPALLPSSEEQVWREEREYQLAAALFHAGRLDEAAKAFQAIAAKPGHAMRQWGGYLALRASLRQELLAHAKDTDSPAAVQAMARLQQQADASTLQLLNPLGQTMARISVSPAGATLEVPDRPVQTAPAVETLMQRAIGFPLPMDGLRYWLKPEAAPNTPAQITHDPVSGRISQIRQDDWTIDYLAYDDPAGDNTAKPASPDSAPLALKRVNLTRAQPPLDVKLVIDR